MANEYRQTNIAGTSYVRSNKIEIDYPNDAIPTAIMLREKMYVLDDGEKVSKRVSALNITYDPAKQYELINPDTGESLGATTTLADIFIALYSVFVAESIIADTEPEVVNE